MAIWSSFECEFEQLKQQLRHYNDNVKDEVRLALLRIVANEQNAQTKERDMSRAFRKEVIDLHHKTDQRAKDYKKMHRLELRRARVQTLLDKLSSFDHTAALRKTRESCMLNTGQWLSKTAAFEAWKAETQPAILACHGKSTYNVRILQRSSLS